MARIEGGRNVQQVSPRVAADPGLRVPKGAFQGGAGLEAAGQTIAGIGENILKAEKRVRDRNDALDRIKRQREFKEKSDALNRDVLLQQDITNPNTLTSHGETLAQERGRILSEHGETGASADSMSRLMLKLSETEFSARDDAATKSFEASQKIVIDTMNDEVARLAAEVTADPTQYEEKLNEFTATFEEMAPHLQIADELKAKKFGEEAITLGVFENYMRNGEPEEGIDFLTRPGVSAFLTPETMRTALGRAEKAQKDKSDRLHAVGGGLVQIIGEGANATVRTLVEAKPPTAQTTTLLNPDTNETRLIITTAKDAEQQLRQAAAEGFTVETRLAATEAGGLTGKTQSDLESQRRQSDEIVNNLGAIISQMAQNEDTVGALGFGAGVLNKTLAQVNPAFFNEDRAALEQLVKATRQMSLRVVSDESRFSETDRDRIEALFPGLGPFESPPRATLNARMLRMFFIRRNILASEELGRAPNIDVSPGEVREAMQAGLLTRTDARLAMELLFPEMMSPQQ